MCILYTYFAILSNFFLKISKKELNYLHNQSKTEKKWVKFI